MWVHRPTHTTMTPSWKRRLEVRGENETEETFHRWANADILPVPLEKRTYTA